MINYIFRKFLVNIIYNNYNVIYYYFKLIIIKLNLIILIDIIKYIIHL